MGCGATKGTSEVGENGPVPSPAGKNLPAGILVKRDEPAAEVIPPQRRKKSVMFEQDVKTITFDNGDSYKGLVQNEKRNGFGIFIWANKDRYEGEWKDNEKHGAGTFIWHNGDRYEGSYEHNMRHGQGIYSYASGDSYDGEWNRDKRHGAGTYCASNATDQYTYTGEWCADSKEGHGTQEWKNGDMYTGMWSKGFKHGQGQFTHKEGNVFIGEYHHDRRVRGTLRYPNGDVFEGEFDTDKNPKNGKITYASGEVESYEGGFKGGLKGGSGVERMRTGEVWEGEFVDGERALRGADEPGAVSS